MPENLISQVQISYKFLCMFLGKMKLISRKVIQYISTVSRFPIKYSKTDGIVYWLLIVFDDRRLISRTSVLHSIMLSPNTESTSLRYWVSGYYKLTYYLLLYQYNKEQHWKTPCSVRKCAWNNGNILVAT